MRRASGVTAPRSRVPGTWRGWVAATGSDDSVRSAPLAAGTPVESRVFPKIRSWFALGAPIELMSPQSVLRILFLVGSLLWPVAGLAWRRPDVPGVMVLAAGTVMVALWVVLLSVRTIAVQWCWALAAVWTGEISLLVWSGHAGGLALAWATLYLPMGLFVALFLELRAVLTYQAGTAVGLWVALATAEGPGAASVAVAVVAVAFVSVSGVTVLLNRSARRREAVDPDTGLHNGFGLAEYLAAPLASGRAVAVAAVALEGIGEAREAMGYRVGTELLRRAVEDIGQVLPARAALGRVDADEVIVVQEVASGTAGPGGSRAGDEPDCAPGGAPGRASDQGPDQGRVRAIAAARALAATLRESIRGGRYLIGGVEVSLRPHVGLAVAPWDGQGVPELVRRASLSARRAVAAGEVEALWDGERGAMTSEDLALLSQLGAAGGRGELWLAYQPQVDVRTGRTVSVEALARWRHPEHGLVMPGRFIPLAERTGLVDRLTEWVLAEALDAQVRWRAAGLELTVSVNLSARTLSRPDLPAWILGELESRGLPSECLTIEMTETAAANLSRAVELLGPLRDRGVRVSIDDFGTGYTSLAALRTLPLDELKIDLQFVQRSATSVADDAIVRAVSQLAHRLGLLAVAEGVEHEGTRRRMAEAGYDLLQGYLLSKPLPEADLVARQLGAAADVGGARP
ncbi:MAG: putative bifunctional diguanylate cyclase/phosphodiesterase [Acidimicrobiales bacterium]